MTKKGKEFFRFDTNLTEEIRTVRVKDINVFAAGEFAFCRFVESKDADFHMASDRIHDLLVAPVTSTSSHAAPNCVLACKDRKLRVLEGGRVRYDAPVAGAASALAELPRPPGGAEPGAPRPAGEPLGVVFGTEGGLVGLALLGEEGAGLGWTVPNGKKGAAVRAVKTGVDFSGDGQQDVCVARDDGSVEARHPTFSPDIPRPPALLPEQQMPAEEDAERAARPHLALSPLAPDPHSLPRAKVYAIDRGGDPRLAYKRSLAEAITSLDGGAVTRPEQPDLVVATYSGKACPRGEW